MTANPYYRVAVVGRTGRRTPIGGWYGERALADRALQLESRKRPGRTLVVVRYTELFGQAVRK